MSDRRDPLSPTAAVLLGAHRPGVPGYQSWALGLLRTPDGLGPIDAAYDELLSRGLVEPAGLPVPVLPGVFREAFLLAAPDADPGRPAPAEEPPAGPVDLLPREGPGVPASVDLPAADFPPSVDLPAVLPVKPPATLTPLSFRQAVRVGLGLGVGFWAAGLAGLGVAYLAVSLFGGPERAPGIPTVAPAGAALAAAPAPR